MTAPGPLRALADAWDARATQARDLAARFQDDGLTHTETYLRGQAVAASACAAEIRAALTDTEAPCNPS